MHAIAPISYEQNWEGAYTFDEPKEGWEKPDFNDRKWKRGEASFGTSNQPHLRTTWKTEHIWVRRQIEVDPAMLKGGSLFVKYSHLPPANAENILAVNIIVGRNGNEFYIRRLRCREIGQRNFSP